MSRSRHNKYNYPYKKMTKEESRSKGRAKEREYLEKIKKNLEADVEPPRGKEMVNPWNWD